MDFTLFVQLSDPLNKITCEIQKNRYFSSLILFVGGERSIIFKTFWNTYRYKFCISLRVYLKIIGSRKIVIYVIKKYIWNNGIKNLKWNCNRISFSSRIFWFKNVVRMYIRVAKACYGIRLKTHTVEQWKRNEMRGTKDLMENGSSGMFCR